MASQILGWFTYKLQRWVKGIRNNSPGASFNVNAYYFSLGEILTNFNLFNPAELQTMFLDMWGIFSIDKSFMVAFTLHYSIFLVILPIQTWKNQWLNFDFIAESIWTECDVYMSSHERSH